MYRRNRRKLLHQQKQKFSEKRKFSSHGLAESQSLGSKQNSHVSAMDWANSETDNFVNINKFIFSHNEEQDSNDFAAPSYNIGSRVKAIPKSSILINEISDSDNQIYNAGLNAKYTELESQIERSENRPARYSGFFSTMKLTTNEGLFPSAYKESQESNLNLKQKGRVKFTNNSRKSLRLL